MRLTLFFLALSLVLPAIAAARTHTAARFIASERSDGAGIDIKLERIVAVGIRPSRNLSMRLSLAG